MTATLNEVNIFFLKDASWTDLVLPLKETETELHSLERLAPCDLNEPRLVTLEHVAHPIFPESHTSQG